jgi:uncharacterized membrane protein YbhN (UPF0104 family)
MRRRALLIGLKLSVSVVLLAWLWSRFDVGAAFAHAQSLSLVPILLAFAILLSHGVLSAWRWRTIVELQGGNLAWREALRLFFIAMFFNQTLSTTIGGDAARVWMLRTGGITIGSATTAIVLERTAGFLALAPLTLVGLLLLPGAGHSILQTLLAVTVALAVSILLGPRLCNAQWRWLRFVGEFTHTARRVLLSVDGLLVFSQSLVIHLGVGTVVFLLAHAARISPGLLVCLTLTPPILLLATLPVTFGGWGLREAALVWLFTLYGIPAEPALAVSVTLGVLVMAAGLPGGVLWVSRDRKARAPSTPPA